MWSITAPGTFSTRPTISHEEPSSCAMRRTSSCEMVPGFNETLSSKSELKESNKLWSSQLWKQYLQLRMEACKIQDYNRVWTADLTIPVRRSNQLTYEATDVRSWSFVGSNQPMRKAGMNDEIIYEIWPKRFDIINNFLNQLVEYFNYY